MDNKAANQLRYVPAVPTFPTEEERTSILAFAVPLQLTVKDPPVTEYVEPVTASVYVPLGIPLNVADPEMVTRTKLSMLSAALV